MAFEVTAMLSFKMLPISTLAFSMTISFDENSQSLVVLEFAIWVSARGMLLIRSTIVSMIETS
jgi:hypothetical protein